MDSVKIILALLMAVHSNGAIRGATSNDSPHKCGSVLCRPVSETFDKVKLPLGYLYITTIAAGSSNISILQLDKSDNLIVLKAATEDHYIINGDDEPSTNGAYKYLGNIFEYKRGNDFELIKAIGPITKAVDVLILVKGPNPGIKYEYYIPISTAPVLDEDDVATKWNELGMPIPDYLDEVQEATLTTRPADTEKRKRKFIWKVIGFGPCNKSCGGGSRPPIFRCVRDTSSTRFYTPRRCMHLEKPVFNEAVYKCNMQTCPAYWHTEEWEECVCKNNRGTRHRRVKCVQEQGGGVAIEVNLNICVEEKPLTREMCACPKPKLAYRSDRQQRGSHGSQIPVHIHKNSTEGGKHFQRNIRNKKSDKIGVWLLSDWNQHCSADCGMGIEHRSIFCDRTFPFTDRCDHRETPDTTRQCQNERNCEEGVWFTADWGECHGDCFNLHRRRKVICVKNEVVAEDNECLALEKPEDTEKCDLDSVDYCQPRWHYSEWTECTKPCGSGSQKRSVKCLEIDEEENILMESNKCKYSQRQPIYSTCNSHKCSDNPPALMETETNELAPTCHDNFENCHLISNKDRLCVLNYYQKNCCKTCYSYI